MSTILSSSSSSLNTHYEGEIHIFNLVCACTLRDNTDDIVWWMWHKPHHAPCSSSPSPSSLCQSYVCAESTNIQLFQGFPLFCRAKNSFQFFKQRNSCELIREMQQGNKFKYKYVNEHIKLFMKVNKTTCTKTWCTQHTKKNRKIILNEIKVVFRLLFILFWNVNSQKFFSKN